MSLITNTNHEKQYDWGDVYLQGGDEGIVGTPNGAYRTAFVEAFPKEPRSFIRGEGATVQEAEKDAWEQYQQILSCTEHEFERRGYRNGAGFCKHCGMFQGKVFEPLETCVICSVPTYNAQDKDGNWYCKEHEESIPEEKQSEIYRLLKREIELTKKLKEKEEK